MSCPEVSAEKLQLGGLAPVANESMGSRGGVHVGVHVCTEVCVHVHGGVGACACVCAQVCVCAMQAPVSSAL